jgi:hypothetical protein
MCFTLTLLHGGICLGKYCKHVWYIDMYFQQLCACSSYQPDIFMRPLTTKTKGRTVVLPINCLSLLAS